MLGSEFSHLKLINFEGERKMKSLCCFASVLECCM